MLHLHCVLDSPSFDAGAGGPFDKAGVAVSLLADLISEDGGGLDNGGGLDCIEVRC